MPGISEQDVIALDQIILEMHSLEGIYPWMPTVISDLQQIRDNIAADLPPPEPLPLGADTEKTTINRKDPIGTLCARIMPRDGRPPYTLVMTDDDNGNFMMAGQDVQKAKANINSGSRTVQIMLSDAAGQSLPCPVMIQVIA